MLEHGGAAGPDSVLSSGYCTCRVLCVLVFKRVSVNKCVNVCLLNVLFDKLLSFTSFTRRNMGDVQVVTSSSMSKNRLTLGKVSLGNEAPTFTLPPRNTRVSQGGTARLEGKVRLHLAIHF